MKIKITLRNNKEIITPTIAATIDGFMEELAMLTSGVFGQKTKYMSKCGDFVDIYGVFIRYSEIDVIEEVTE